MLKLSPHLNGRRKMSEKSLRYDKRRWEKNLTPFSFGETGIIPDKVMKKAEKQERGDSAIISICRMSTEGG